MKSCREPTATDWDGSASGTPGGAIVGSLDRWWKLGLDTDTGRCRQMDWGVPVWVCKADPSKHKVARIDWHIPGYTVTRQSWPGAPTEDMGTVSQIGFTAAGNRRSAKITRNTGTIGTTGALVWIARYRESERRWRARRCCDVGCFQASRAALLPGQHLPNAAPSPAPTSTPASLLLHSQA